jgi:hypothetical protein
MIPNSPDRFAILAQNTGRLTVASIDPDPRVSVKLVRGQPL